MRHSKAVTESWLLFVSGFQIVVSFTYTFGIFQNAALNAGLEGIEHGDFRSRSVAR
jgi:hypothetical protein